MSAAIDRPADPRSNVRLGRFAWGVLAYNLLVIAWGAYVRASGSGAGCGRHWPLCNGELVPRAESAKTLVEASHRLSAGIAMIAVVALTVWTLRTVPRGHRARRASVFSALFILGEALIGAALVLFELVAKDESMKRGLSMVLHLGNTFLLLGALTITAWTLTRDEAPTSTPPPAADSPSASRSRLPLVRGAVFLALSAVLVLGCSGAIAALGDTLFPATSLRAGIAMDLSPLAHVFLRLRVLHPFLALAAGAIVFATASVVRVAIPAPRVRAFSRAATLIFAVQFGVGLANVTLLAPIGMQLVHLLLADATWIALVLMAWEALYGLPAATTQTQAPFGLSAASGGPQTQAPFGLSAASGGPQTQAPFGLSAASGGPQTQAPFGLSAASGGPQTQAPFGLSAASGGPQSPIMSRNGPAPMSDVPPSTSNVDPVT